MKINLIAVALVSALIGFLLGAGVMKAVSSGALALEFPITSPTPTSAVDMAFNSKATVIRFNLNNLLKEHVVLGSSIVILRYAGMDATHLVTLSADNKINLANLIEEAYGSQTRDNFLQLWEAHELEYLNYNQARKTNNAAKMTAAKNNLQTIATNLGALLAGSGNAMSAGDVSGAMMEHVTGMLSFSDAVAGRNITKAEDILINNYEQAGKFADLLSRGIIIQNPDIYGK